MPIAFLGGTHFRGEVGQPLPEDLVVQVKDESGKPIAGKVITFTCQPAGSLTLGTERQATDTTKADGTARIRITVVRMFGPNVVRASVEGTKKAEHAECTVEGYHQQVEVREMNGHIVAIRRATPPPPQAPLLAGWPLAVLLAVLVAALLIGGLALNSPSSPPAPVYVSGGGGGGTARALDAEARRRVTALGTRVGTAETRIAVVETDVKNRPTYHEAEGFTRTYVAPTRRLAIATATGLTAHTRSRDPGVYRWLCEQDPGNRACD